MNTNMTDEVAAYIHGIDFDVTDSENTGLDQVPDRAYIQFAGESERRTTAVGGLSPGLARRAENDAMVAEMMGEGIGIRLLIERAMLDPDAEVIPVGGQ
ncbi:hypothetical protein HCTV-15_gp89 [Haloarcula virus HCTV-15]|nr:hypothetical protein HCTV-6_gp89 [Haloarcula virus HCTV-6]UBF22563.1 hypothetical protein HCTV-15_gp89 [Haloarcula virus HCTV-15]